jgi:hypothetical protein
MRAIEFTKKLKQLDEISMKPTRLAQVAGTSGAMAGVEFEMIVPGSDFLDDEPEFIANDLGTYATSVDQVISWFGDCEMGNNGRRVLQNLRDELDAEYSNWTATAIVNEWKRDGKSFIEEVADEYFYFDEDDAIEQAKNHIGEEATTEEIDEYVQILKDDLLSEWIRETYNQQTSEYDAIYDDFTDDQLANNPALSEEEFYSDMFPSMDDIYSAGLVPGLEIPMVVNPDYNTKSSAAVDLLIDDFTNAVGRHAIFDKEHGGRRVKGAYTIEPDGSLRPTKYSTGLEFVSPTLPLDEMLNDMQNIINWARDYGCVTGPQYKTGLHMNVSVPGTKKAAGGRSAIDYVKLALLVGDEYILEKFGRIASEWAESAHRIIIKKVQNAEDARIEKTIDNLRNGLIKVASNYIHAPQTKKYVSLNVHSDDTSGDSWVEFRSPGGDWLSYDFNELKNTINRFVVALQAATNPEEHRQEYLKKLYKLISANTNILSPEETLFYSRVVTGELDKTKAKEILKRMAGNRRGEGGGVVPGDKYDYEQFNKQLGQNPPKTTGKNYVITTKNDGRVVDILPNQENGIAAMNSFKAWLSSPANKQYNSTNVNLRPEIPRK